MMKKRRRRILRLELLLRGQCTRGPGRQNQQNQRTKMGRENPRKRTQRGKVRRRMMKKRRRKRTMAAPARRRRIARSQVDHCRRRKKRQGRSATARRTTREVTTRRRRATRTKTVTLNSVPRIFLRHLPKRPSRDLEMIIIP